MSPPDNGSCAGCGASLAASKGRKPRKWCSESCRVATFGRVNPAYRERHRARRNAAVKAARALARADRQCSVCGLAFAASRSDRKTCSDPCRYRATYLGRRARQLGADREPYTAREVAERDGWSCGLCFEPIEQGRAYPDPACLSIDHVLPLARGGSDTLANVQASHLGCNWKKGARLAA